MTFLVYLTHWDERALVMESENLGLTNRSDTFVKDLYTNWSFDTLSPKSQCFLRVFSLLDPDSIEEGIVTKDTKPVVCHDIPTTYQGYLVDENGTDQTVAYQSRQRFQ